MRWLKRGDVLRRQRVAGLRFRALHDRGMSRALAMELVPHAIGALNASRHVEARELLTEAVTALRTPEAARPGVPDRLLVSALVLLSVAELEEGRVEQAHRAVLDATEVNRQHENMHPDDPANAIEHADVLFQMALVLERLDYPHAARATAEQASSLLPDDSPLRRAAQVLLERLPPAP